MIKKIQIKWKCTQLAQQSKMQEKAPLPLPAANPRQSAEKDEQAQNQKNTAPSTQFKLDLLRKKLMLFFLVYFEPMSA